MRRKVFVRQSGIVCLGLAVLLACISGAGAGKAGKDAEAAKPMAERGEGSRLTRQGLHIDFAIAPATVGGVSAAGADAASPLIALQTAELAFTISDAVRNEPIRGLAPGAWIDKVANREGEKSAAPACKERVGLYLSGRVGLQPLIDVNSYLVLTMNRDATLSVVDPNVIIGGTSSVLYDQVMLSRPGEDWVLGKDRKRLFVTMPRANAVAVVDADRFELIKEVGVGPEPVRASLQPDGRFVWVGTNAQGAKGGVSVIDTHTLDVIATLETGKGHHEIAFSSDDRLAVVTNRKDGTVTIVDAIDRTVRKQVAVGPAPISVVFSPSSKAFYVADGERGTVHVIAADTLQVSATISAQPGLGPMQVTADGRWLFVTNTAAGQVYIIDTSSNALAHSLAISGKPYQLTITRAFAYVRALDSERVSMINLSSLGKDVAPIVTSFVIGSQAPAKAGRLPIASSVVEAAGEAGVIGVDPVDGTLVYYMEGMTAPMGSFRSLAGKPRGVMIVDRFLAETTPGRYATRLQLPAPGRYEAAFVLDSPKILHCFAFEVRPNPLAETQRQGVDIEYLTTERRISPSEAWPLRFRLLDKKGGSLKTALKDVQVLYFRAPGYDRSAVLAADDGNGVYEARLNLSAAGAWYVYISSPSAAAPPGTLPFITVRTAAVGAADGRLSTEDGSSPTNPRNSSAASK